MIINGGSRSNGRFFASHLMRADHNERVEVRDIRGLLADNVPSALREMQTMACGTLCKNWFYHADINTREDEHLTPAQWVEAADALERELKLTGQPRFIVEHEKNGRTHQHIVWSRIDLESMTAISDSHNYLRHETVARALEKAFEHLPTPGALSREYGTERPERCPKDTEALRAQDSRIDPKAVTAELTALWKSADSGQAFAAALAEQGYVLTRGDRRDFCVIDQAGDDHSLARRLTGVKAAEVRARMGDIDRDALPSVAEGRQLARNRLGTEGEGGNAAFSREQELPPEATRPEMPLGPFEAVMAEKRRLVERAAQEAQPKERREASPVMPEREFSPFDQVMAETRQLAARTAAQEREMPEEARRAAGWQAWQANMRRHLVNLRGKLLEWWREYFQFDQPQTSQKEYER